MLNLDPINFLQQHNTELVVSMVRQQFRKNMHETDPEKIQKLKDEYVLWLLLLPLFVSFTLSLSILKRTTYKNQVGKAASQTQRLKSQSYIIWLELCGRGTHISVYIGCLQCGKGTHKPHSIRIWATVGSKIQPKFLMLFRITSS